MGKILDLLYEKLSFELDILEEINKIEEIKFNLLVAGKLEDFTELNENLELLIDKSNSIEKERIEITKEICQYYKIDENSGLKDIIPYLENSKEKFEDIYNKFAETLSRLKYLSSSNSEMLKNTIKIIDITLSQFTEDDNFEYGKSEKEKKNQSKSILLNKLA